MLYDIRRSPGRTSCATCSACRRTCLPEVLPSSGRFGVTTDDIPCGGGVPIAGIAGDQQAALFGQACFSPGMTKNTYGTGSFVLMNIGETCPPPVEGLLTTVAWTIPDAIAAGAPGTAYALEGAVFITGAAIQWLRDGLGIIDEAAEIGPLAQSCDDTDGVYLVPAFTGLGSPWWDPYARGTIVGITRGTGRPQLARAVVESMAYQVRDVIDAMSTASGRVVTELRVDGGASVMDPLLQFQADQIGVSVTRPSIQETTALGSALPGRAGRGGVVQHRRGRGQLGGRRVLLPRRRPLRRRRPPPALARRRDPQSRLGAGPIAGRARRRPLTAQSRHS